VRKVTWRSWLTLAAGLATYAALGWLWSSNGTIEAWLYRVGLTAAAVVPVLFACIYTAKTNWWQNEIGASLVVAALSLVPIAGPLAVVFWFMGGMLHQSWLAWLEVSGPCLSALAWLRLCWVWLRVSRDGGTGMEGGGGGDGTPGDARHRRPHR
jgi:hypothetical protein